MAYIIVSMAYPTDKQPEVNKRTVEAYSKYPLDENLGVSIVPAAMKPTTQGLRSMGVVDVKKGKLEEAYIFVAKFMAMYQSLEDFEYSIDIYFTGEESFQIVQG